MWKACITATVDARSVPCPLQFLSWKSNSFVVEAVCVRISLHIDTWVNKSLNCPVPDVANLKWLWTPSSSTHALFHTLMASQSRSAGSSLVTFTVTSPLFCLTWNHFQFIYYAIDSPCLYSASFGLMYHCFVFLLHMWWFWFIYNICCAILIFILVGWLNKYATLRTLEVVV